MQIALLAIGAGIGYGLALWLIPEALLHFRMGGMGWGLSALLRAVALAAIATVFALKAWKLYRAQK